MRRLLPLLSALITVFAVAPAAAAPVPPQPLPPERAVPAVLDAPIEYEGMTTCDPTPRPGAMLLRQLLLDTYGAATIGISRACDQDTISEHKEGRAVDWMVDFRNPVEKAQAQTFVDWVTAPGPDGTPAANARRLGIMYIGWGNEMWRAYDTARGWTELRGCYSRPGAGDDTDCHRNHVHFSLTWDGAAARTSYWDGTPVVDSACPVAKPGGSARTLSASAAFVPISPVRVFDGRNKGDNGCYLQQRRWSGDDRSLPIQVTGRKGVPKAGVQAVAVRVTAYASNAPGWISAAGSPGSGGPKVVSLGMTGSSAATAIVPVSDTGRIWLATVAGHARVAVDVVGYFARASSASAGTGRPGTWQPGPAQDVPTAQVPAGQTVTVDVPGAPKGALGAVLTVNTSGSSPGHIRVATPGAKTRADAVDVGPGIRSATVFARMTDGEVALRNTSGAQAAVSLTVSGWITAPTPGNGRLAPTTADLGTVKTAGPPAALTAKVPASARAAVLAVTTKGAAKAGGVTVWGAGQRPSGRSVDVLPKRSNTDLVVVALGEDKTIRIAGDARKGSASVRLVGVVK
jgi:hypothetical protein